MGMLIHSENDLKIKPKQNIVEHLRKNCEEHTHK